MRLIGEAAGLEDDFFSANHGGDAGSVENALHCCVPLRFSEGDSGEKAMPRP
ncbi:polyribonucleotide nucleotidyltransferase [Desulfovibrio sp. A2]|nr:polyribonucleotide nucleotidyltransferase [Desulfovibrio sp. A2]